MSEGQTMKRLKDKQTKGQTVIYKTLHRRLRIYNVVSSTIGNNQCENCISLDFNF